MRQVTGYPDIVPGGDEVRFITCKNIGNTAVYIGELAFGMGM